MMRRICAGGEAMIRKVVRGTVIGGLLGGLFGLVGPCLYALSVFGFVAVCECIQEREIVLGFWEFLLFAGMAMIVSFRWLPLAVAICGVSGILAGLVASIMASRSSHSSAATAVVCGVAAVIPVAIFLSRPLSPYLSTDIVVFYLPSVLYVGTMALLGAFVRRRVVALVPRCSAPAVSDLIIGGDFES
jgi:hypothetical protein